MIIPSNLTSSNNLPVGQAHRRSGAKGTNAADDAAGDNLLVNSENLTAAGSPIQDANGAEASTEYARANILALPNTAMLAQANLSPQNALRLLQ